MKKMKKILSVFLAVLMLSSLFQICLTASAVSSVNFTVSRPVVGMQVGDTTVKSSTSLYQVVDFEWLERAPGESEYHMMSYMDTFEAGNEYRCAILFVGDYAYDIPISVPATVNGQKATMQDGNKVWHDFGTLGGFGGSGGGVLSTIGSVLLGIITAPFQLIYGLFYLIYSAFAALFGLIF